MDPEFITYQKFNDPALAEELAEQLDKHHIAYALDEESFRFDPGMVLSHATREYTVKIKAEDFEKVNELLKQEEIEDVSKIDQDYYLFSFTDDELMDVIAKADEWNPFDIVLARKLLAERGKNITDEQIAIIHKKRIEELKAPDAPQTFWIVIGYLVALVGGVMGIFIGWYLFKGKKTLPNGERVFEYSENDRHHGKRIFYLSIVVFVIAVGFKLAPVFSKNY